MDRRVAILYGTGEGKRVAGPLIAALRTAGYAHTDDVANADILIAHSGGGLVIPHHAKAKAVLIAGPINGCRHGLVVSMSRKVWQDYRFAAAQGKRRPWFRKTGRNISYVLLTPRYLLRMYRAGRTQRYTLPDLPDKRVAIVIYRDDPWSKYLPELELHHTTPYSFISHSGLHDDLWMNPEAYVGIIQYLMEPDTDES